MARVLYRIVRTNPPSRVDFMSHEALGKVPRDPTPELLEMWRGVSAYDDIEVARGLARRRPGIGPFIAVLSIEEGAPIVIKRSGRRRGHHDLYGAPAEMQRRVVRVEPV
jgi:hypothetical protein